MPAARPAPRRGVRQTTLDTARTTFADAYPGVECTMVRSLHGGGIDLTWVDGPMPSHVKHLLRKRPMSTWRRYSPLAVAQVTWWVATGALPNPFVHWDAQDAETIAQHVMSSLVGLNLPEARTYPSPEQLVIDRRCATLLAATVGTTGTFQEGFWEMRSYIAAVAELLKRPGGTAAWQQLATAVLT